jgi:Tfp pilus assembly protein PilV
LLRAFASAGMCSRSHCLAMNYSGFQASCHNIKIDLRTMGYGCANWSGSRLSLVVSFRGGSDESSHSGKQSKVAQAIARLACIQDVPLSNLVWDMDCPHRL